MTIADELVPPTSYLPTSDELDRLGYRYELDIFAGEHLTLAINDEYGPAAEFLGTAEVDRNPPHVTFVADPGLDHPELGFVAEPEALVLRQALRREGPRAHAPAPGAACT